MTNVDLDEKLRGFRKWAGQNLSRIHDMPYLEAAEEIGNALLLVDGQLGAEVAESISDARELIVTAFASRRHFMLVHRIVAAN